MSIKEDILKPTGALLLTGLMVYSIVFIFFTVCDWISTGEFPFRELPF